MLARSYDDENPGAHRVPYDIDPSTWIVDHVPDLTDYATRALCLAELARRCGLDPEGGVIWALAGSALKHALYHRVEWMMWAGEGDHCFIDSPHPDMSHATVIPAIRTDDPLLAVALALEATAQKAEP
jgi:hypothetical protein